MIRRWGRVRRVNFDNLSLRDIADFGVAVGVRFNVRLVDADMTKTAGPKFTRTERWMILNDPDLSTVLVGRLGEGPSR